MPPSEKEQRPAEATPVVDDVDLIDLVLAFVAIQEELFATYFDEHELTNVPQSWRDAYVSMHERACVLVGEKPTPGRGQRRESPTPVSDDIAEAARLVGPIDLRASGDKAGVERSEAIQPTAKRCPDCERYSAEGVHHDTCPRAIVGMGTAWLGHNEPDDRGAEDLPAATAVPPASIPKPWDACDHYSHEETRKRCSCWRGGTAPSPRSALDGLFNGAALGLGGKRAAELFNIVRADLDAKYSRDEHVAALEAMEASAMSLAAHLIARWLRRYADEHSGSHPGNAGYIACNAAATELETGRATWRTDV